MEVKLSTEETTNTDSETGCHSNMVHNIFNIVRQKYNLLSHDQIGT